MPPAPAARASSQTSSARISPGTGHGRIAQYLERERQQGVAGENGGGFVIGAVDGRLAAAQIVVVHAGEIVVDERVDVDALDREAGPDRALPGDPEQAGGGDGEERSKPLAAADGRVAHRLIEAAARIGRIGQDRLEQSVDLRRGPAHRRAQDDGGADRVDHRHPIATRLNSVVSSMALTSSMRSR